MQKLTLSAFVLTLAAGAMLELNSLSSFKGEVSNEAKRQAYEAFLASHPYSNHRVAESEEEGEELKTDRPDLAMEQDFLATLDPALGYVPSERLATVYTQVNKHFKNAPMSGYNWTERGPNNVGGRTRAIVFDPNDVNKKKVWAGGVGGGLWYCNDITVAGATWTKVDDVWNNLAVTSIAFDPTNPQIAYVGTGEGYFNNDAIKGGGIFKTTDGGATWTRLSSTTGSSFSYIQRILVHPVTGDVYVGTRSSGVQRSKDKGTTWQTVLNSATGSVYNDIADIEIGADNTLYVATSLQSTDGIYKSASGDVNSWSYTSFGASGFPTSGYSRIELACAPSNASVLYALVEDNSNTDVKGIYKSSDKGASWTAQTLPVDADNGVTPGFTRTQAWYDLAIAVDPVNSNTLIVGGVDLFRSTNGGASWSQISHWYGGFGYPNVHADQHVIAYRPGSSTEALFGNDGGISYSANLTSVTPSFTSKNTGFNVTQFYSCAINPTAGSNVFLAGAQDNGTQRFSTAGMNNTTQAKGGDGAFCFIDQDNPNYCIASYVYNSFNLSTNGGTSFPTSLVNSSSTGDFINPSDYDDRENILYAANSSTTLTRVLNVTGSFTLSNLTVSSMGTSAAHIRVSPYSTPGTSTIYVGTKAGRVYKITNAHATPTSVNIAGSSFPLGNVSCVEIGASESELLVTFSNYGVNSIWYTSNGGTTWVSKEGNLPDMPVRWALFNPNNRKEVMIATESGVWSTSDISVSSPVWAPSSSAFPNVRTDMLQIRSSDNTVIAATHGRGLFSTDAFATVLPVADFSASPTSGCPGTSISFTNKSTGATTYSWSFPGGTPSSSTALNPTVVYSTAGTYSVTLIASSGGNSNTKTMTNYISISPMVADSSLTINQGFENSAFPPTNWSIVNPNSNLTWQRYTSGGGFGTSASSLVFTNYSATNMQGQKDDIVLPKLDLSGATGPKLTFDHAYAPYSPSGNDSLAVYYSLCGGSWVLLWQKGGSTLATAPATGSEFYPTSGQWKKDTIDLSALIGNVVQIKFTNISDYGNDLYVDNINIKDPAPVPPVAGFTYNANKVCLGGTMTYTKNTSGTISSYAWNFGAGATPATSTLSGPVNVVYSTPGVKTVKLVVSGPAGKDSSIQSVTIYDNPVPSATVNHITCYGAGNGMITLNPTGGASPYSYVWNTGGTTSSKSGLGAGVYSTTITDANGCNATTSATITQPTVISNTISVTPTQCSGNTGAANVVASGGTPPYAYNWSGGGNTNLAAGTYSVTITDANACVKTASFIIQVNNTLFVSGGSSATICAGGKVVIGGSPTATGGTTPYSFSWSPAGSLSNAGASNPTASPTANTTYIVVVTDNGSCTKSSLVSVNVKAALNPSFTTSLDTANIGQSINFNGTATGATSYNWKFGDGGTGSGQNTSYVYNTQGTYQAMMIAGNGICTDTAYHTLVIIKPNSVIDLGMKGTVKIYPNPASDKIHVDFSQSGNDRLELVGTNGQVLLIKDKPSMNETLDLNGIPAGMYMLRIGSSQGYSLFKINISK